MEFSTAFGTPIETLDTARVVLVSLAALVVLCYIFGVSVKEK